jgi:hypothetical protein
MGNSRSPSVETPGTCKALPQPLARWPRAKVFPRYLPSPEWERRTGSVLVPGTKLC